MSYGLPSAVARRLAPVVAILVLSDYAFAADPTAFKEADALYEKLDFCGAAEKYTSVPIDEMDASFTVDPRYWQTMVLALWRCGQTEEALSKVRDARQLVPRLPRKADREEWEKAFTRLRSEILAQKIDVKIDSKSTSLTRLDLNGKNIIGRLTPGDPIYIVPYTYCLHAWWDDKPAPPTCGKAQKGGNTVKLTPPESSPPAPVIPAPAAPATPQATPPAKDRADGSASPGPTKGSVEPGPLPRAPSTSAFGWELGIPAAGAALVTLSAFVWYEAKAKGADDAYGSYASALGGGDPMTIQGAREKLLDERSGRDTAKLVASASAGLTAGLLVAMGSRWLFRANSGATQASGNRRPPSGSALRHVNVEVGTRQPVDLDVSFDF